MTAAQWFHDALSIYQGATSKDAVVKNIVKTCVGSQQQAADMAEFLAHLQAALNADAFSREETTGAQH